MRPLTRYAAAACLALAGAACDDFISGPGLTEDPNNPSGADALQLFVATEASLINQQ